MILNKTVRRVKILFMKKLTHTFPARGIGNCIGVGVRHDKGRPIMGALPVEPEGVIPVMIRYKEGYAPIPGPFLTKNLPRQDKHKGGEE